MSFTIAEIAAALGAEPLGDPDLRVLRPAEPGLAGPDELAVALSPRFAAEVKSGRSRAALLWDGADWTDLGLASAIVVPRGRLAMAHLTSAFRDQTGADGIHSSAVIAGDAVIGADVAIGPFTVIGAGAQIGAGTRIGSHASLADGAIIGEGSRIHDGVRIARRVRIGARAVLHPGVVIGADGFSFATAGPPNEERAVRGAGRVPLDPPADAVRHKIHSLGGVEIGDDVEIGANSCVDAGTIRATRIGRGTKIDNLVQVGHNVLLGEDCVISAQGAIAGSARIGDRVVMGGKSGVRDNVTVGSDVVLGGGAIVLGDVAPGSFVMGYPAVQMPEHRARERALRRLQKGVSKPGETD